MEYFEKVIGHIDMPKESARWTDGDGGFYNWEEIKDSPFFVNAVIGLNPRIDKDTNGVFWSIGDLQIENPTEDEIMEAAEQHYNAMYADFHDNGVAFKVGEEFFQSERQLGRNWWNQVSA
jgi:hypothetical protein